MISQTENRTQVSSGSPTITNTHSTAPVSDTTHTNGTRNGRGRPRSVYRSTSTPTHTRTNANSVPMFVRLYVSPASPMSDHSPTKMPVISVVTWGTRVLAWTRAAHGGSRPSRPIAKKMRGWPYWKTSSTAEIEMIAPRATIQPTVVNPALFSALANGSATPSSVCGTIPVSTAPTIM